jgi:hypothetical protein
MGVVVGSVVWRRVVMRGLIVGLGLKQRFVMLVMLVSCDLVWAD